MRVNQIFDEAAQIVGTSDKKEVFLQLTNAIDALSFEGDWDSTLGYVDICAAEDKCFALPNDVDTPLAINIGGRPAIFRDSFYEFHLNGPGSDCGGTGGILDWSWIDKGGSPVVQNIINPSQIIAQVYDAQDYGAGVRIYGTEILSDGREVPVYTTGPSKPIPNRYLTATFTIPAIGANVTVNLNSTDSLYVGLMFIVLNQTTGRLNTFTVQRVTNETQLVVKNDGTGNESPGIVLGTDSILRYATREEGWLVPTTQCPLVLEGAPYFAKVTAITKPQTVGFIKIVALDTGREEGTLLAFMLPNETESSYRKIQVPKSCQWIRMKYRRVNRPIESCCDEIFTDCKLALLTMLRALRKLKEEDFDGMQKFKLQALDFMQKSEERRHPSEPNTIAVNHDVSFGDSGNMI